MMISRPRIVEPLLLSTIEITTYRDQLIKTNATGFFYEANGELFLITSRHVLFDDATDHRPDQISISVHTDHNNLVSTERVSISLYSGGMSAWRELSDQGGVVDVAAIRIDKLALPPSYYLHAFSSRHIPANWNTIMPGSAASTVGFPLGFHDTLHRLPVVRQSSIASAIGLRFQGGGFFLTDARTHRGSSGSPVVMFDGDGNRGTRDIPWLLLGVHSSRFDVGSRDVQLDEALGLNCCWYADVIVGLTN
ncbi:MAG: trypsin-like peptidase domain-containing protein [Rhodospirillales bacterium]